MAHPASVFRRLAAGLLLRGVVRDLHAIATELRVQNGLLQRLADRLAPVDPHTTRGEVVADTGVDHVSTDDVVLADDYRERTYRDTGHVPDDDEVLIHLRDERTADLGGRLAAREAELQRLAEDRNW